MFALVSDIESYPGFIPWCRSTRILSRHQDELQARIELAKGNVRKQFTTHNRLQPDKMIEIHLLEGPFKRLEGCWRFHALDDDACKVMLDMDFEFSSTVMHMTVGPVFSQIINSMVDAFCRRAREVYGRA